MRARALAALLACLGGVVLVLARPQMLRRDLRPPVLAADVLVVGGSPAGVAAAVAAARQGRTVLLVERRPYLGTVWTGAMLNMVDLSRKPNGEHLVRGIFLEVYGRLGGVTFDPRHARRVLRELVEAEPGIQLLLQTEVVRPLRDGARVKGALLRFPDGEVRPARAAVVIDATDDGDLAAAAGVRFTYGRETSGLDRRAMPATLLFRVAGVDWRAAVHYAWSHRRGRQPSGALGGYAWGFRDLMFNYQAADERTSAHDLNLGRLPDGTIWINALQVHDVDGTDPASVREGYERARAEIPRLLAYLRAHVPGFERARLVELAPELYVRETRHLAGLYTLTADDIAASRVFWDRVAVGSYPIDLHQYRKGERYPFKPVRRMYTIPLRALVTAGVDGLFVASRAFSATYQAAGSARVVPTTMAMGQAVGVAAAVAVEHGVTPHQLAAEPDLVREVQRRLVHAGAVIEF
ncbi:MAG: FAD-dependent oxidoreductase [Armatimonadota bacterium]|nr:FAD-dependent oxidoreductase [Armatimonadota bacterium]